MKWTLREIATLANGQIKQGDAELCCGDPVWDSRQVADGAVFVPLKGEKLDGHQFIAEASRRGATASFVRQDFTGSLPEQLAVILVDDPLAALQRWAHNYLKRLQLPVVAVTGSIGKTSTKEMTAAVLSERWRVGKTRGNLNTEMGLPLTVLQSSAMQDLLVLEMAMRGPGEILELTRVAPPDVAVITNVGESHIELLGSRENIALAKGEVLQGMKPTGIAVLNADDRLVVSQAKRAPGRVIWFGQSCLGQCDALSATSVVDHGDGLEFVVHWQGQTLPVAIPRPGLHNLSNGLAALAVGLALGMSLPQAISGLGRYQPVGGRLRFVQAENGMTIIDDTYNAGPASMRAALKVLTAYPHAGRRIAVLGDMLELGLISQDAHRELGELVAALPIDQLITFGPQATLIAEAARQHGLAPERVLSSCNHQVAIEQLRLNGAPSDLVLVKGSRGMEMEQIVKAFTGDRGTVDEH